MTKSIDKIRAEVEAVREEHQVKRCQNHQCEAAGEPFPHSEPACDGDDCNYTWPCPTLKLAERMLKLAEALEAVQSQCGGHADEFSRRVYQIAERVLADVVGDK